MSDGLPIIGADNDFEKAASETFKIYGAAIMQIRQRIEILEGIIAEIGARTAGLERGLGVTKEEPVEKPKTGKS